jgi:hypothetical protein
LPERSFFSTVDAALLKAAIEENARLKEEKRRLRSLLGIPEEKRDPPVATILSPEDKVTLFQSLFRVARMFILLAQIIHKLCLERQEGVFSLILASLRGFCLFIV